MDNQKQELIQKLRDANNILVTVSSNPSVDQLSACIGLTIFLNKMGKHATAVFSGQVPSTLEFLKPEDTLEKNTDSLRDFIVSLDKTKADKLRYKVEDNVVKIFITPYKTSISEADLDFSQGDFNIDVVICLGVEKQADLDQAITSHGRILHDATVASISVGAAGELGTLNWVDPQGSSLSELAAQIADTLNREQIDGQIATAFLTGVVAETNRFSNEKTSPTTMQLSAQLMAAGANQQLVANELQNPGSSSSSVSANDDKDVMTDDGELEVDHKPEKESEKPAEEPATDNVVESVPTDTPPDEQPPAGPPEETPNSRLMLQPPSLGGTLTANSTPESFDPSVDPLTLLNTDAPMLNRNSDTEEKPEEQPGLPDFEALPSEPLPNVVDVPSAPTNDQSLASLEVAVDSPHLNTPDTETPEVPQPDVSLDALRAAVDDAASSGPQNSLPTPTQATGSEGYLDVQNLPDTTLDPPAVDVQPSLTIPAPNPTPPTSVVDSPSTAPPVPPPLPLDPTQFPEPKQ